MIHYILDGNNIIGKDKELKSLQIKEPQLSREKLVRIVERYFSTKKIKVTLHLDGHQKDVIRSSKAKLIYSEDQTADDKMRFQIEHSKNPKKLTIVTSDRSLAEFAKVCSCTVISSEQFIQDVRADLDSRDESDIQKEIDDDEIKKLFGL